MFDFDGGAARLRYEDRVDTVQPQNWAEVKEAINEIASANKYKTVVVDTASKMIDLIIEDVCGTAQPKIQQWGLINAKFKDFIRNLASLNLNVIFVAQRSETKDGDTTRFVPQFRESNYKDVVCDLDIVGYLESIPIKGVETRVVTFEGTSRNEGKNTGGFEKQYVIPELTKGCENDFFTQRFAEFIERQHQNNERGAKILSSINDKIGEYETALAECTDAVALNDILSKALEEKPVGNLKIRLSKMISTRSKELNLTLNKKAQKYE